MIRMTPVSNSSIHIIPYASMANLIQSTLLRTKHSFLLKLYIWIIHRLLRITLLLHLLLLLRISLLLLLLLLLLLHLLHLLHLLLLQSLLVLLLLRSLLLLRISYLVEQTMSPEDRAKVSPWPTH